MLAALAFQAVGFLLGSVMRAARAAQAVSMLLCFPMWLLSGAAPPPSVMTAGMRRASDVLPLTFAVRAIQHPWLGSASHPRDLLLLVGVLGAAAALSIRAARTRRIAHRRRSSRSAAADGRRGQVFSEEVQQLLRRVLLHEMTRVR